MFFLTKLTTSKPPAWKAASLKTLISYWTLFRCNLFSLLFSQLTLASYSLIRRIILSFFLSKMKLMSYPASTHSRPVCFFEIKCVSQRYMFLLKDIVFGLYSHFFPLVSTGQVFPDSVKFLRINVR
jgi:hypothetical protein